MKTRNKNCWKCTFILRGWQDVRCEIFEYSNNVVTCDKAAQEIAYSLRVEYTVVYRHGQLYFQAGARNFATSHHRPLAGRLQTTSKI